MEIRSLTCFADLKYPFDDAQWRQIEQFATRGRAAFAAAGLRVQSIRLATQPFPQLLAASESVELPDLAVEVEATAQGAGVGYVSLGPASGGAGENAWMLTEQIHQAIAATSGVFLAIHVASSTGGVDFKGIAAAARAIREVSRAVADGFGNLRLASLACVGPWAAFFPAAYHGGGPMRFAVATEAADLAVQAFAGADSPLSARHRLTELVQRDADRIVTVARELAQELGIGFAGIDFSLAPYPDTERSVAHAVELLTGGRFGERGTLFAASAMTEAVRQAEFPKTGFSGLMLPVLEDSTLAARSREGTYDLDSLLLYSSVCGTGLDTVPLPGDIRVEELAAILADISALAVRLNKPLTARLMPIPGKREGEITDFEFEYFANAAILGAQGSAPLLWR